MIREETMMKKPYEKPAFIMENFDTGEITCSTRIRNSVKDFLGSRKKPKRTPSSSAPRCADAPGASWRIIRLLQRIGHGLCAVKNFLIAVFVVLVMSLVTKGDPNDNTG